MNFSYNWPSGVLGDAFNRQNMRVLGQSQRKMTLTFVRKNLHVLIKTTVYTNFRR